MRQRGPVSPTVVLLLGAVVASGALLLALGARVTFMADDWQFLIDREGWSTGALLDPHNEHIVLLPITVYKLLQSTFGMDSALPFRIVATILFLSSAVLLFAYLRSRTDEWLAWAATVLILFLGGAHEDLLWSFQMGLTGAMASGLGMLLALQRRTRRGDRAACVLLAISMAFSSLGLCFAAGAAVAVALDRERWRRTYVVAIPLLLFAAWWIGWGQSADTAVSLENLARSPLFVAEAIASGLSSMLGLSTSSARSLVDSPLDWGRPLLAASAGLAAWRLYKLGAVPRWLWVVTAIGFSFWILAALNSMPGRESTASRYQYVSAVFILLIAAELAPRVRIGRRAAVILCLVVGLAVASNVYVLDQQSRVFRTVGIVERADLGALEIVRGKVNPAFALAPAFADAVILVSAGPYYATADDHGSPAYTPRQIARAPEQARAAADRVLAAALGLRLQPIDARPAAGGRPPRLKGSSKAVVGRSGSCIDVLLRSLRSPIRLPTGGVSLRTQGAAEVRISRFARQAAPVELGRLKQRSAGLLSIPSDRSEVPWKLSLRRVGPVTVCGLGGGADNSIG